MTGTPCPLCGRLGSGHPSMCECGRDDKKARRVPLNMRSTPELRRKIEEAAAKSGRSLAQEVEFRVELSFWVEAILGRK